MTIDHAKGLLEEFKQRVEMDPYGNDPENQEYYQEILDDLSELTEMYNHPLERKEIRNILNELNEINPGFESREEIIGGTMNSLFPNGEED